MSHAFDIWLSAPLPDQGGLPQALRHQIREALQASGFPFNKTEAWKYTSLRQLERQPPDLYSQGAPLTHEAARALLARACPESLPTPRIVFIDGRLYPELSEYNGFELDFADDVSATNLAQRLNGAEDAFVRLALAYSLNTWRIQPQMGCDDPLSIFHLSSPAAAECISQLYLQLDVPANQHISLMERFYSERADTAQDIYNYCLDIHLGRAASLQHGRSLSALKQTQMFARSEIMLDGDAAYHGADVLCGEAQVRHELRVRYQGEHSAAHFYSAARLVAKARLDQDWKMSHDAGHCETGQTFRAAVDDQARASYTGRALIPKEIAASSVQQSSRGLMLSDDSEVNARPVLEIYADEVQASHGATVGCLDESALHYLRTRGVEYTQARMMLIDAFVVSALADYPQGWIKGELVQELHGLGLGQLDLDLPA